MPIKTNKPDKTNYQDYVLDFSNVDFSQYGTLSDPQQNEESGFWDKVGNTALAISEGLTMIPMQVVDAAKDAYHGGEIDVSDREELQARQAREQERAAYAKKYEGKAFGGVAEAMNSAGYSLTTMGASLGGGAVGALAGPVASAASGMASGGAVAYRASKQEFLRRMLGETEQVLGRMPTQDEWNTIATEFDGEATRYGLWEAGPEALSNLFMAKLLGPLGKGIFKGSIGQGIKRAAGLYGEEFGTETITQMGQGYEEAQLGLRDKAPGAWEAFTEVAPATFWQTTLMAGGKRVLDSAANRMRRRADEVADGNTDTVPDAEWEEVPALPPGQERIALPEAAIRMGTEQTGMGPISVGPVDMDVVLDEGGTLNLLEGEEGSPASRALPPGRSAGQLSLPPGSGAIPMGTEQTGAVPIPLRTGNERGAVDAWSRGPQLMQGIGPFTPPPGPPPGGGGAGVPPMQPRPANLPAIPTATQVTNTQEAPRADTTAQAAALGMPAPDPMPQASPVMNASPAPVMPQSAGTAPQAVAGQPQGGSLGNPTRTELFAMLPPEMHGAARKMDNAAIREMVRNQAGENDNAQAQAETAPLLMGMQPEAVAVERAAMAPARQEVAQGGAVGDWRQMDKEGAKNALSHMSRVRLLEQFASADRSRVRNYTKPQLVEKLLDDAQGLADSQEVGSEKNTVPGAGKSLPGSERGMVKSAQSNDAENKMPAREADNDGARRDDERATGPVDGRAPAGGRGQAGQKELRASADEGAASAHTQAEIRSEDKRGRTEQLDARGSGEERGAGGSGRVGRAEPQSQGAEGSGSEGTRGRSVAVKVPGRNDVPASYELVDADDIQASHLPQSGFQKNPKYGLENERRYHDEPGSQAKVLENAAQLDPAFLLESVDANHGAPVVDAEGNVLGGNGRAMSVQYAYAGESKGAAAYRKALEDAAERLGIDREAVRSMRRPTLVRRIDNSLPAAERQSLVAALNDSFTDSKAKLSAGKSRGSRLSKTSIGMMADLFAEHDTLRQAFDDVASLPVVERLFEDGVLQKTERNAFVGADGLLNPDGKAAVEQALAGLYCASYEIAPRLPADVRGKMDAAIPHMLRADTVGGPWPILHAVREANDLLAAFKASGAKNQSIFLGQVDMFTDKAPQETASEAALKIFDAAINDKKADFAKRFQKYANYAEDSSDTNALPGIGKSHAAALREVFGVEAVAAKPAAIQEAVEKKSTDKSVKPLSSLRKDGEGVVGHISKDVAAHLPMQKSGEIRLSQAALEHIEQEHGQQIRNAGFKNPAEFVRHAIDNANAIYEGNTKRTLYIVAREKEKPWNSVIVRLEFDHKGDHYQVKTAHPMNTDRFQNKKLLWDGAHIHQTPEDSSRRTAAHASSQSSILDKNDTASDAEVNGDAPQTKNSATAAKPDRIEDFGEKIGGARKDIWTDWRSGLKEISAEDILSKPLEKIFPEPKYEALLRDGANPKAVGLVHAVRDIAAEYKRAARKRPKMAEAMKDLLQSSVNILESDEHYTKFSNGLRANTSLSHLLDAAALYEAVGHAKSLAGVRITAGNYSVHNGVKYDPPKIIWSVEKRAAKTAYSSWPKVLAEGKTKEEAVANFKKAYDSLEIITPAKKEVSFILYRDRGHANEVMVGVKIGRTYTSLAGPFKTADEARAHRDKNKEALTAKLDAMKNIPSERRDTNNPRVGEDMRSGEDVTPQMFSEAFGFRGVEFGNWVEKDRRQADLNQAYDALMDMAGILGLTPRALSLNGELGLAFGARGVPTRTAGGSTPSAHYEPGKIVINLTKKAGAGSLAHEWFHAVDNYFSRMREQGKGYLSDASDVASASRGAPYTYAENGLRKEIVDAWGVIKKSIRENGMQERSRALDTVRTTPYWGKDIEMGARAFEAYIVEKLQDNNASNDYLVNIVDENIWGALAKGGQQYPYPTKKEMPAITAAFDNLFQVVETKETDKGVALASLGARRKNSDATPVGVVEVDPGIVPEFASSPNPVKALKEWILNELAGRTVTIKETGRDVTFTAQGVRDSLKRSRSEAQRKTYGGLVELIENAAYDRSEAVDTRHMDRVDGQEVYYAAMRIKDGGVFSVRLKLDLPKNAAGGLAYKDHKVTAIDISQVKKETSPMQYAGRASEEVGNLLALDDVRTIILGILRGAVKPSQISEGALSSIAPAEHLPPRPNLRGRMRLVIAQRLMDALGKRAKNAAPSRVVQSFADLSADIREAYSGNEDALEAAYDPKTKTVWFVADNLTDSGRATEVWMHEQVVHHGLRSMFSEADRKSLLKQLWNSLGGMQNASIREIADTYGLNPRTDEAARLTVMEEVVASMAEKRRLGDLTAQEERTWKRIVDAILRAWKAAVQAVAGRDARAGHDNIDSLLAALGRHVMDGASTGTPVKSVRVVDVDPTTIPVDTKDTKGLVAWLRAYYGGRSVIIRDTDEAVTFTNRGLRESAKRRGDYQRQGYAALDRLLEEAAYSGFEEADAKHAAKLKGQKVYFGAMRLADKIYSVKFKLDVPLHGEGLHFKDHKVTEIELAPTLYQSSEAESSYALQNVSAISDINLDILRGDVNPSSLKSGVLASLSSARKTGLPSGFTAEEITQNKTLGGIFDKIGAPKPTLKDKWDSLRDNWMRRVEQGIFDQFASIKDVSEEGYKQARMTTSLGTQMQAIMEFGAPAWKDGAVMPKGKGLVEVFAPVGAELDRFLYWMVGNRAARLKGEGRENLFTDAEIAALQGLSSGKNAEGKDRSALFQKTFNDFAVFKKQVLDFAQEAGLIDPESRALWEQADYIPFYRIHERMSGVVGPGKKGGLTGQKSGITALKGGLENIGDPLENIVRNFSHLMDAAQKNRAAMTILRDMERGGFAERVSPEDVHAEMQVQGRKLMDAVAEELGDAKAVGPLTDKEKRALLAVFNPKADFVSVMHGGKPSWFTINDPLLHRAVTNMRATENRSGPVWQVLRAARRALTTGVTAMPDFMIRNFLRDTVHTWAVEHKAGFVPFLDSMKQIKSVYQMDEDTKTLLASGAAFMGSGYRIGSSTEEASKALNKMLDRAGMDQAAFEASVLDTPKNMLSFLRKAWGQYEKISSASENSARLALYKKLKAKGYSEAEATFAAKDIMDFTMRGEWEVIRGLTEVVPFLGARLAGLHRLGRGALEDKRAFFFKGLALSGLSVALYAINLLLHGDEWDKLEDWERDSYFHFWVGDEHFRMPKPFEVGFIFGTIPERIAEQLLTDKEGSVLVSRLGHGVMEQLAFNPLPQLFKPAMEQYMNKDSFRGTPIEGMGLERKLPVDRYTQKTSLAARGIATIMDTLLSPVAGKTGLDVLRSPARIEHLVRGYFGGMGLAAMGMTDAILGKLMDVPEAPEKKLHEYPIVGSFYRGGKADGGRSRYQGVLYEHVREADALYASLKEKVKGGQKAAVARTEYSEKELQLLALRKRMNSVARRLGKIGKREEAIRANKYMDSRAKREQIDRLRALRDSLAKNIVQKIEAAR